MDATHAVFLFAHGGARDMLRLLRLQRIYFRRVFDLPAVQATAARILEYVPLYGAFADALAADTHIVGAENAVLWERVREAVRGAEGVLAEPDPDGGYRPAEDAEAVFGASSGTPLAGFSVLEYRLEKALASAQSFLRCKRLRGGAAEDVALRAYRARVELEIARISESVDEFLDFLEREEDALFRKDVAIRRVDLYIRAFDLERYVTLIFGEGLSAIVSHRVGDADPVFASEDPYWMLVVYDSLEAHLGADWYSLF